MKLLHASVGGGGHILRQQGRRATRVSDAASTEEVRLDWSKMKGEKAPRAENVRGAFFVDHTCIDCDTCRWMAPNIYARVGDQSAVVQQPQAEDETVAAYEALLSCPTFSIHATTSNAAALKRAREALPAPIPGCANVYHTGWHSEKSYAGVPYLITRPGGNVLVDSPRFNPVLAKRIEELGGVKYMFLTHRDDVGDHKLWAKRFKCQRIIHEKEVNSDTRDVELKLKGKGPWQLEDAGDDVEMIFTPGHTSGHVCLYYKPSKAMFTGDHLFQSRDGESFRISEAYNWYSVPIQRESVRTLLQYDFLHILPGHGRRMHLRDDFHRLQAFNTWAKESGVPTLSN